MLKESEFETRWGQDLVQTGFGIHLTSYSVGTGGSFPGVKAAGA
jgi:hypothetical protein